MIINSTSLVDHNYKLYDYWGKLVKFICLLLCTGRDPCEGNVCGRGFCFVTDNSTFGYECECEDGWRQARYVEDGGFLKFLPCVVPNCEIFSSYFV